MRKLLLAFLMAAIPALSSASSGGGPALMPARLDPHDTASLQRGAKLFVSYCAGCHSAQYMRYSRLADDLKLPPDLVQQYLIFTGAKIGDTMTNAMTPAEGTRWFGVAPPDLSLTVRRRGADWVYTYLNTFYRDDSKATGVNNLVFPDVGMPHVLAELQGVPEPVFETHEGADGKVSKVLTGIKVPEAGGTMTPEQYQAATRDLTNFLGYVAEPVKAYRQALGIKVILFLLVFGFVAYLLKREYWKDVH